MLRVEWSGEDDLLDATFSGYGPMASAAEFMDGQIERTVRRSKWIAQVRHFTATSGAMRWPWSEEAPIRDEGVIRVV